MVEKGDRGMHARRQEKGAGETHRGEKRTGRQYPVGVCPDPTVAAYPSRVEQPLGRRLGRTCPRPKEGDHQKTTDGVQGHAYPRARHPLKESV